MPYFSFLFKLWICCCSYLFSFIFGLVYLRQSCSVVKLDLNLPQVNLKLIVILLPQPHIQRNYRCESLFFINLKKIEHKIPVALPVVSASHTAEAGGLFGSWSSWKDFGLCSKGTHKPGGDTALQACEPWSFQLLHSCCLRSPFGRLLCIKRSVWLTVIFWKHRGRGPTR